MVKEVLKDNPITISEVSEILTNEITQRKEDEKRIGYAQRRSFDHVQKFSKTNPEQAKKLRKELLEHEKVTPELAVKLTDLMPKEKKQIRAIYAKERFALDTEVIEQIQEIINKYR
ncbi:DNA-directed RNA polymerase subunit Rpo4/RpoF [Methanonatronarchaeum thermophilum]|uniref:DNA-directed RNA polymerase subunit Rpo4 n=1 Tax=Methanonatronarchaeum thermophilum TaxID=1927129 RepID=A0A1Y3GD42_9EURY|nr:RNA polymerase Rpb4 family protein [Methanonatronarchaeum thermophilum]OUJ19382.1 DNA-directed RNA polymerase subunit Rpo4/RpoF [Methanonatronarchaeum thermophilum]